MNMKRYYLLIILVCIAYFGFGQSKKVYVTLNPNDCVSCLKNTERLRYTLDSSIAFSWVMHQTYKGHQGKLEKALGIQFNDSIIFSDSVYRSIYNNGSQLAVLYDEKIIVSFDLMSLNQDNIDFANSLLTGGDIKELAVLPDSILFSNNVIVKEKDNGFFILDKIYDELIFYSSSKGIARINGENLFNEVVYKDVFGESSGEFNDIQKHYETLKKSAYSKIAIKNVTFTDSNICMLCYVPVVKQINERRDIGVYHVPSIIYLSEDLTYKKAISLEKSQIIKQSNISYYLSPDLFEYNKDGFYLYYYANDEDLEKETDCEVFGKLNNNFEVSFLEMKLPNRFGTILSRFSSGFISNHYPKLYNYAFPFEFDLLSGKINEFPFERFSYDNLRRIVEGDFSNTQIFNILSVYQKDRYLMILYREGGTLYKESYDLVSQKKLLSILVEKNPFKTGIVSNLIPTGWNTALYLDSYNRIVELSF
ncbi:hypothetical protein DSECCO2_373000 [anaerobic digester metagenome]